MSDLEQLQEFGFEKERAELALKAGGSLQGALDWLEKNNDRSLEELKQDSAAAPGGETGDANAKSYVCNDCGKKLRSFAEVEFHVQKSQHENIAESTEEIAPLTAEEKQQRLEELRAKLAAKRAGQSEADKQDKRRNEEIRRKSTKEQQDAKEELQKKEKIKEAQKKRQEQLDDIAAKKRIREKIEQDKRERKEKAEKEKAARQGQTFPADVVAQSMPANVPVPATTSKPASAYTETRLRLQTPNGTVQKSFSVDMTLFELAQQVKEANGTEAAEFVQNFPRKVYSQVDFGMTLKEAGLVPSAALVVR